MPPPETTWIPVRILAGLFAVAPTGLFVWHTASAVQHRSFHPGHALTVMAPCAAFATLCWWFVVLGGRPAARRLWAWAAAGSLTFGCLGLVGGAGYALVQGSNIWPLAGIFFTGPIGFTIGFPVGVLAGLDDRLRRRRRDRS